MIVELTRIHKHGATLCIILTRPIRDSITWKDGDKIAVRQAGEKLVLERVPMEQLAKLRTGEASAERT